MSISKKELNQRVAVLKRLRSNLMAQREKFRSYLDLLEKEATSIEDGKIDILEKQVQIEKNLVGEISAFQRVIEPLDQMAKSMVPADEQEDIQELRSSLDHLREQVQSKNTLNREALKAALADVNRKIIKVKPVRGRNPYGGYGQATPSMIDITT